MKELCSKKIVKTGTKVEFKFFAVSRKAIDVKVILEIIFDHKSNFRKKIDFHLRTAVNKII